MIDDSNLALETSSITCASFLRVGVKSSDG